jgi:hypothetical protein
MPFLIPPSIIIVQWGTSLTVSTHFDRFLVLKGRCMYLHQVSWRPHTSHIGFSTQKYLHSAVQTVWTVTCCLHTFDYTPTKGCNRHFSIRNAVRSTRSIGMRTWLSCVLPVVRPCAECFVFCSRPWYKFHATLERVNPAKKCNSQLVNDRVKNDKTLLWQIFNVNIII